MYCWREDLRLRRSDRIVLFSQESIFGGLLNFVDTGILTMGELVRALLY